MAAPAVDSHRRAVRLALGAREYPLTLILGATVLVVFRGLTVILTLVFDPDRAMVGVDITYLAMALVMFGLGLLLRGDHVPLAARPWVFAIAVGLIGIGLFVNVALLPSPLSFAVVLLLLCTCGPATLAWLPFLLEVGAILLTGLIVLSRSNLGPTLDWFMLTVGAAALSAILLRVRLRTVYDLADATAEARRLADTDQLTGILNRRGLTDRADVLWAEARRLDESMFVVFVDIRGLKQANDRFGHEFGDRVIQAAARAVCACVREGDLVARWGGDELIVVGTGSTPEAEAFNERVKARSDWAGPDRDRWPGELSVGFADALASVESVDGIISRADEDMYRRRQPG